MCKLEQNVNQKINKLEDIKYTFTDSYIESVIESHINEIKNIYKMYKKSKFKKLRFVLDLIYINILYKLSYKKITKYVSRKVGLE